MQLLALDFDGVISDSAPESFVVSARTYLEMEPGSSLRSHLAPYIGESLPALDAITEDPLYAGYIRLMPLGNRAEDYAVALTALERGSLPEDQTAYDAFRDDLDPAWLRAYHKRFYAVRAEIVARGKSPWQALIAPYPAFVELLRRRAGEVILAIATAKDRRSVSDLLEAYGIADLFRDRVLDKETGVSKEAHLAHLSQTCGIDFANITFVDDKANHLDAVSHLGVRCALAAWGYNGEREEALARERGYLVCGLSDVEAQLFG